MYELGTLVVSDRIEAAFLAGILSNGRQTKFLSPTCSTSNCTWPRYKTIAICSNVADISHSVFEERENRFSFGIADVMYVKFFWPGVAVKSVGRYSAGITGQWSPNTPIHSPHVRSKAFQHLEHSTIADFFVLWVHTLSAPKAVEVNLHFCVQELESYVQNGVAHTKEVGRRLTAFINREQRLYPHGGPNLTIVTSNPEESFAINSWAREAMLSYTETLFDGIWYNSSVNGLLELNVPNPGAIALGSGVAVQAIVKSLTPFDGNALNGIEKYAESLAMVLSNRYNAIC